MRALRWMAVGLTVLAAERSAAQSAPIRVLVVTATHGLPPHRRNRRVEESVGAPELAKEFRFDITEDPAALNAQTSRHTTCSF